MRVGVKGKTRVLKRTAAYLAAWQEDRNIAERRIERIGVSNSRVVHMLYKEVGSLRGGRDVCWREDNEPGRIDTRLDWVVRMEMEDVEEGSSLG